MTTPIQYALNNLYPDVDPATPQPLTRSERFSIALASAVLAFGAITADLIIGGVGIVLLVFATVTPSRKTSRRIRYEARTRFPNHDWAENDIAQNTNLRIFFPIFWITAIAICFAAFWFSPTELTTYIAIAAALAVAIIVWFMPGLNPRWSSPRAKRSKRTIKKIKRAQHMKSVAQTTTDEQTIAKQSTTYTHGSTASSNCPKSNDDTTEIQLH
ncbi:hypothetical protein UL82_02145 [Corynebacterium kutscheri]|uniref:Uncharacterized protein n=1 Tax=Corynebacterium kutscheri TaxID=35755 RepID=A0A0F6TCB7_9CORY|nr:hypothetical protein [Corynebacterium kutscheri]AKE40654.1 hypothetical protein UL82_02145 [Corynebacterium kutscheri]VEH11051.1 cell-surface hemin receptor [Corynebacterium kutscheri]